MILEPVVWLSSGAEFDQNGKISRTPDRETQVRSSAGSVCCFLEQEKFTPQNYW